MKYGYFRVSTAQQNVENGIYEIENFAQKCGFIIDNWVVEQISSQEDLEKRKLNNLLRKLRKGDILITTEISRLGRKLFEIMEILNTCLKKGCEIWTIKENYKLRCDIQSKVLAFCLAITAELERTLISQRTKEALARIKASGKKLGRPVGYNKALEKLASRGKEIEEMLKNGTNKRKIARIMKVSPTTLYKYMDKYLKSNPPTDTPNPSAPLNAQPTEQPSAPLNTQPTEQPSRDTKEAYLPQAVRSFSSVSALGNSVKHAEGCFSRCEALSETNPIARLPLPEREGARL